MALSSRETKLSVLRKLGGEVRHLSGETFRVGQFKVHTRYKSGPSNASSYPFNYGAEAFAADYELWVCGGDELWYLVPSHLLEAIHGHPDAYPDRRRPNLRVLSVDASTDRVLFAAGGLHFRAGKFKGARLPSA